MPNVNKVVYGNDTIIDLTGDTITPEDVLNSKSFHDKSGALRTGSADISGKADKVSGATNGNFAGLDSTGNLIDSGKKASDFATTANAYLTGDTAETALADADYIPFYDTSATAKRKSTWSNIKSVLKIYFDTLYSTVKSRGTPTSGGTALSLVNTGDMYNWNNKASTAVVSKTANGLAPQLPNETTTTKFLRQDGSWQVPSYPTVNNATLTIQKNGTNVQTFTANQSSNATANIITDIWSSQAQVSSGSITFTGIDDTNNNGYELFINVTANSTQKNPVSQISSISGTGTSNMSITFSTDADEGAYGKLRIIK